MSATYTATEVARLAGVSTWTLLEDVRRAERGEQAGPLGRLAIRVGRRVVWPRRPVDALLGLESGEASDG